MDESTGQESLKKNRKKQNKAKEAVRLCINAQQVLQPSISKSTPIYSTKW